jgi:succinate dehydrogenase / fumarate reductase cytochrome b subunit
MGAAASNPQACEVSIMEITNRPLSPHLQIYKPQLTSVLSIAHRGTGVLLVFGTLFLVYWLIALAAGPEAYASAQALFGSVVGQILLFLWVFALFYHLCNGIRHLFWDMGLGFELKTAYTSGVAVIVASLLLTLVTYVAVFAFSGGAP